MSAVATAWSAAVDPLPPLNLRGGGFAWEIETAPPLRESIEAYWRESPVFDAAAPPIRLAAIEGDAPRPAAAVFGRFLGDLGRALAARGGLLLHASGVSVAGPDGERVILLVGDSGAGKSTGAATLVSSGGAAPFVDDGAVAALRAGAPWAAPGPLRSNPFGRGAKRILHGRIARRAPEGPARLARLGAVVLLGRDGPAGLERLGRRAAFLALAGPAGRPEVEPLVEAIVRSVPVARADLRRGAVGREIVDLAVEGA